MTVRSDDSMLTPEEETPMAEKNDQTEGIVVPGKRQGSKVLDVKYEYVSPHLDSNISSIDTFESVRAHEVEEYVEYFDSIREPLARQLVTVVGVMERKIEDPYRNLRLPDNLSVVSLSDLQDIVAQFANAFATYAEYLSAARSIYVMRENLYERRKNRASVNEGSNELERKALASMRSEPEFLQLTKVSMLVKYIETRYFAFKGMLEAAQQVLTTKSVEATRQMRDDDAQSRSF